MGNMNRAERILRHYADGLQQAVGNRIVWKVEYQRDLEEAIRLLFDGEPHVQPFTATESNHATEVNTAPNRDDLILGIPQSDPFYGWQVEQRQRREIEEERRRRYGREGQ